MQVYINYPNPHFTIHGNSDCQQVQMHKKSEQRRVIVNPSTLNNVLEKFIHNTYDFKSRAEVNDLWLDISLASLEQELGFVHTIQAVLGQRYKTLGTASINKHC